MRSSDSKNILDTVRTGLRKRTSITLLGAMLLAMLVLAGFTFQLLKNQRQLLEQTLRESRSHVVALLASTIEQTVIGALRQPFLVLQNIPLTKVAPSRLQQVTDAFPELKGVVLLSADMQVRHRYPRESSAEQNALIEWMTDRALLEKTKNKDTASSFRVFAEQVDGQSVIFATQRVNELDPKEGWILMYFDLHGLVTRTVEPQLREFSIQQGGSVKLAGPDEPWDDEALNWPVNRALPGWVIAFRTDPQTQTEHLRREQTLILSITSAVIVALLITTFAVWRELRREHALVELRNRFVANVSHELKTPLALIRMFAETLYLHRLTDSAKKHEYHRVILREAERLSTMIDNVLSFSRMERRKPVYQLHDSNLAETVDGVLADYRQRIEEQGLTLRVRNDEILPPVAHDRSGVRQILLNLLDNAMKFGKRNGAIEVTLRVVGDRVELSVVDEGPGIPADERERLRQPFERGSGLPPDSGSGLGLAVVEQIAQIHGATVRLEYAREEGGLRATVVFPVKQET